MSLEETARKPLKSRTPSSALRASSGSVGISVKGPNRMPQTSCVVSSLPCNQPFEQLLVIYVCVNVCVYVCIHIYIYIKS